MNLVLRDSYAQDCERAVERWNKTLSDAGIDFNLACKPQTPERKHRRRKRHKRQDRVSLLLT